MPRSRMPRELEARTPAAPDRGSLKRGRPVVDVVDLVEDPDNPRVVRRSEGRTDPRKEERVKAMKERRAKAQDKKKHEQKLKEKTGDEEAGEPMGHM